MKHAWSASELKEIIALERQGKPFLVFRDPGGQQQLAKLFETTRAITVGRDPNADIDLSGDEEASRAHCQIERVGTNWILVDDGMSTNGTFINGLRLHGRLRCSDGDVIKCGGTLIVFRDPSNASATVTRSSDSGDAPPDLTEAQFRVLSVLCQPCLAADRRLIAPATNSQIAEELFISLNTVKSHMKVLFSQFGLDDAPQSQKRIKLVDAAINSGLVRP